MEAAARAYGFGFEWNEFDWSCETYAKTGRMMPEDGLDQLRLYDAVFLGAVGHPEVPDHVSLWGLLIPLRRELSPIRQSAPGAAAGRGRVAAARPRARRHRLLRRAREQRGRIFGNRRPALRRHRVRDGDAASGVHPPRLRPDHALRLRARPHAQKARHLGDQVERHHPHDAVSGTSASPRSPRDYPGRQDRPVPHRHPDRAFRAPSRLVRCRRRLESVRRHPVGSRAGGGRLDRHRALGQHQPRARISRRCSSRCTARRPTSPGAASPTRSARSGRAR